MSPKNSLLKAGLSALGMFGFAALVVADPPSPVPPDQASSAAPRSESEDAVLLMSDGQVLRGKVTETAKGYLIKQRGNTLPKSRESVQGVFRTLEEAYRFQAERLPARDPDEQMKLARWCMTNHMMAQAKIHLKAVSALSPDSPAKQMLEGFELAEARATSTDPEVRQAGAEAPRELNMGPARSPRRSGPLGPPQIFDLPPGVALRRWNEFVLRVQPVLQRTCANCHNENHPGEFQLVQFRSKYDKTPEALGMNLDATLRLVNPDDPGKSEILSSCLRPHGDGPKKRPIFLGSNNPDYQVLSTWVHSLKTPQAAAGVMPASLPAEGGEAFAAGRGNRRPTLSGDEPSPLRIPEAPAEFKAPVHGYVPGQGFVVDREPPPQMPASRYVPGRGFVAESRPPASDEFPIPVASGGTEVPKRAAPRPAPEAGEPPAELPALPATDIPPPVPAPGSSAASSSTLKKPRKPVKIDETILQQMLQQRNSQR